VCARPGQSPAPDAARGRRFQSAPLILAKRDEVTCRVNFRELRVEAFATAVPLGEFDSTPDSLQKHGNLGVCIAECRVRQRVIRVMLNRFFERSTANRLPAACWKALTLAEMIHRLRIIL